jgi:tRNA(Ile)-lysidine synthase
LASKEISIEQSAIEYVARNKLIPDGATVLVTVSGGPDSVCLLHLLVKLRKDLGIKKLHVAHLNHKLRGAESDDDAWYVISLCQRLKIPSTIDTRDVNAYHKLKRITVEEAARELRYSFFSQVLSSIKADCVATAHTRDDHIETILMHIIRGTGIDGLRGLQPKSILSFKEGLPPITLIRPLLEVSKQDTVKYCRRFRLAPRVDSTNKSIEFFRNRIRLKLLPELKKYNPGIDTALLRLASIASDQVSFIEQQADEAWATLAEFKNNVIYLNKQILLDLPFAMQRQIFRLAIKNILGTTHDFEAKHVEDMVDFLNKKSGKVLCLPCTLRLSMEYDHVIMSLDNSTSCIFPSIGSEILLNVPGETQVSGWKIVVKISDSSVCDVQETAKFRTSFDLDKTGRRLYVRHRKVGDRFQPLGMGLQKKLQDFMVDSHIPQSWRDSIPILCSPKQILWVVGYRIDDRVKIRKATKKVLNVTFQRISDDCRFRA